MANNVVSERLRGLSVETEVLVSSEKRAIVACVHLTVEGGAVRLTPGNARRLAKLLTRVASEADEAARAAFREVTGD